MYYHLSKKDHGSDFLFKPRVPESSVIDFEGDIPRVCVTPRIIACLHSIAGTVGRLSLADIVYNFQGDRPLPSKWMREPDDDRVEVIVSPTVYRTHQVPYKPPKACDFHKTEEGWFIKSIRMERIGYLNIHSLMSGSIELSEVPSSLELDISTLSQDELNKELFRKLRRARGTR